MNNQLISITEQDGKQLVSAKELYEFFEIKTPFRKWIDRMLTYGFEENKDYTLADKKVRQVSGTKKMKDYALTLDCAKEISMIQRSEKGKQARTYFIDCEKRLDKARELLGSDTLAIQRAKIEELETKMKTIEAHNPMKVDMFTVKGYASLTKQYVDNRTASNIGRKATKICKKEGLNYSKIQDPRFGTVGLYPTPVLKSLFKDVVAF